MIELSDSKIKIFFIFPEIECCTFSSQARKIKRIHPEKNLLYFRKRKPRNLFLYFLKGKLFLYLAKQKPRKRFLIFQETELSYISGNGNSKKLLIFQEETF